MRGYAPSSVTGLDFEAALRYEAAFVKRRDLPYTRHSYGLQNTLTPSWSASTLEYPKVGADASMPANSLAIAEMVWP